MISYLEERLEQASIVAIINARRNYNNWLEGNELAQAALASLDAKTKQAETILGQAMPDVNE